MTSSFWDQRYSNEGFVYGDLPNEFLASYEPLLPKSGSALDIGAGEGRNALFLASRGLDVLAVDQSAVGLRKAERRAQECGLKLQTRVADLADFEAQAESLHVISSIFVHLPSLLRAAVHSKMRSWLTPGGVFVLEAYAPDQLTRSTGGPKDPDMLAPLSDILHDLHGLEIVHQAALVRNVVEGPFHTGEASVVQVIARRN